MYTVTNTSRTQANNCLTTFAGVWLSARMETVTSGELVNTGEALAILGQASPSTITRLVRSGQLTPAMKLPGLRGAYLFNRADVEALAAERAA